MIVNSKELEEMLSEIKNLGFDYTCTLEECIYTVTLYFNGVFDYEHYSDDLWEATFMCLNTARIRTLQSLDKESPEFWEDACERQNNCPPTLSCEFPDIDNLKQAIVAAKLWMQVGLENSEYLSAAIVEFIARDGDTLEQH